MSKVKSVFTGLASRKQRREEARTNNTEFVPRYNGQEPMRVQHPDVLAAQLNAEKRKAKLAKVQ